MIHNGINPIALVHGTLRLFKIVTHGPIYSIFNI